MRAGYWDRASDQDTRGVTRRRSISSTIALKKGEAGRGMESGRVD